jgi:phage baseplate assembly protein W
VSKTAGQLSVEEAFIFILGTFTGERIMKPAFGSKISSVLFELNTDEAKALLRTFVMEAASQEPRISTVHKIGITTDPADPQRLNVSITFRLIQQTSERNIVIPILRGAQ